MLSVGILWWRRRSEVLYGLFALAVALWGIRSLTFILEVVPSEQWTLWRLVYHGATGGFVVVMALFALRLAGLRWRWLERVLLAYALAGPLWLLAGGAAVEPTVNRVWSAGLMPVGLLILVVACLHLRRERRWHAALLPAALIVAVLAGVHDYLIAWDLAARFDLARGWAHRRIFLLHYAADLLLLAMGALLGARFLDTLERLEDLNHTLESRVADRERHLADNFARLAALERQNVAARERQAIMREIHDGLGSRLFTSLSRVERGDMDAVQIAQALRDCIADLRLALDALAPEEGDFRTALGNFLFRWQAQLQEAGVRPSWVIDVPDSGVNLAPQAALQLLRIAQEALTNVLKHARASRVRVGLHQSGDRLALEIVDDGPGGAAAPAAGGRGIANMRSRARQLGSELQVAHGPDGTRVALSVRTEGAAAASREDGIPDRPAPA